jgi:hypothetical protein
MLFWCRRLSNTDTYARCAARPRRSRSFPDFLKRVFCSVAPGSPISSTRHLPTGMMCGFLHGKPHAVMQFDGATKLHGKSGFGLHRLRKRYKCAGCCAGWYLGFQADGGPSRNMMDFCNAIYAIPGSPIDTFSCFSSQENRTSRALSGQRTYETALKPSYSSTSSRRVEGNRTTTG